MGSRDANVEKSSSYIPNSLLMSATKSKIEALVYRASLISSTMLAAAIYLAIYRSTGPAISLSFYGFSIFPTVSLSIYICICLSIHPSFSMSIVLCRFIHRSSCPAAPRITYRSFYRSMDLSIYLSVHVSV